MRWLGVLWDRKLSFQYHVRIATAKAIKPANALGMLGGYRKGAAVHLLLRVVKAMILPRVTYAAEA